MSNQNIKKVDSITKQAIIANGRSSCKNCPIGQFNCNEQHRKLCIFSFIKGYKSGRAHQNRINKIKYKTFKSPDYC